MERVGDRQGKLEWYCATGQSPQRVVVPMEEEEEEEEEEEIRVMRRYVNIIVLII